MVGAHAPARVVDPERAAAGALADDARVLYWAPGAPAWPTRPCGSRVARPSSPAPAAAWAGPSPRASSTRAPACCWWRATARAGRRARTCCRGRAPAARGRRRGRRLGPCDGQGPSWRGRREALPELTCWSTTPASTAHWAHWRTALGGVVSALAGQPGGHGADVPRGGAPPAAAALRQDRQPSPAAAPPRRSPASAPTPPPRRRWCASRETLAHELRDAHVDVNAIAPGALNTRLLDEVLAAGPERVGADFYERA